ncbi:hypothetical protein [Latilactobacillus fragifolii]|uniref:hypothetical protein n=1 Tax=Latilactobacillus fragifolii TaxID=2814244 RepID=UPI001ABA7DD8|nr:hypothetical protein [Latilactobacillus fragifolii]
MAKEGTNQANPLLKNGQWQIEDHTQGQDCSEALLFMMKDRDHEFALPLSVVLSCLRVAETEGYVPSLSDNWWIDVKNAY